MFDICVLHFKYLSGEDCELLVIDLIDQGNLKGRFATKRITSTKDCNMINS